MAQDDDLAALIGCCVIHDPNAEGGVTKHDNFTEQACKDAAETFRLSWNFYPGKSCSSV